MQITTTLITSSRKKNNNLDIMNNKKILLVNLQNVLFWIFFIVINLLVNIQFLPLSLLTARMVLVITLNIIVYYICYKKLAPNFFVEKTYVKFYVYALLIIFISCSIRLIFEPSIIQNYMPFINKPVILWAMIIISQSLVVFIACMLSISNETLALESALTKTQIEKNEADLNLLKAKINPHFLLNTLNNIYAINYEESPRTSGAIMQLSKVLSYTIYKSKNSLIVLSEEIELLESLIGLYQLKFDNQLRIQLTLNETVTQSPIEIPSLVLFSLLENAFKHSDLSENPKTYVNINLDLKGNKLIFEIINSVSLIKKHADANYFSGLGVDAIKQLLKQKYNNNFNFEIDKKNDSYKVTLIIYEL